MYKCYKTLKQSIKKIVLSLAIYISGGLCFFIPAIADDYGYLEEIFLYTLSESYHSDIRSWVVPLAVGMLEYGYPFLSDGYLIAKQCTGGDSSGNSQKKGTSTASEAGQHTSPRFLVVTSGGEGSYSSGAGGGTPPDDRLQNKKVLPADFISYTKMLKQGKRHRCIIVTEEELALYGIPEGVCLSCSEEHSDRIKVIAIEQLHENLASFVSSHRDGTKREEYVCFFLKKSITK